MRTVRRLVAISAGVNEERSCFVLRCQSPDRIVQTAGAFWPMTQPEWQMADDGSYAPH
jgi:hypothetical protein